MAKQYCVICDRNFKDEEGLAMHEKAKHPENVPKEINENNKFNFKKIRNWSVFIAILILIVLMVFYLIPGYEISNLNVDNEKLESNSIPPGAVHWHPRLSIIIDGKITPLTENLGHTEGRIIDTHLSGMGMSPLHTHKEKDGTIHLENSNPSSKPETLALGYFFYVWDKVFNSTCIFEYCNDKGEMKMFVNGNENFEFQNYIMKDKDIIKIEYITKK
ncbi:MAG: hypothetical protein AABW82_02250 [Nanoarchaeota archaeon]